MLQNKIKNTIKKYGLIKNDDNIVVGVSGGPDSMTLLNILIKIKEESNCNFGIVVAHVNHMIRQEAEEETKYVQKFCRDNNIQCYIKRADVQKIASNNKIGTEEAGRNLRYSFFEEILAKTKSNKIATAHTANDNAETVLMNIIRGAGTSGLKGIEPIRDNKFIRPLIDCTRIEIEEYCKEKELNAKIDKTNNENIYTRNKVRNLLIPYIQKEFNPNIITSLNRLSKIATNENQYIEENVIRKYQDICLEEQLGNSKLGENYTIILDLKKFNRLNIVIKNRLILYTINKVLGTAQNIEQVHIADIVKLCEKNIGNKYLTPNKNIKVLVKEGKIFFIKQK